MVKDKEYLELVSMNETSCWLAWVRWGTWMGVVVVVTCAGAASQGHPTFLAEPTYPPPNPQVYESPFTL